MRGTVTDIFGSRVVGATLHFVDGERQFEATTAQDGTYTIQLPPGVFSATATRSGFCTMARSSFILDKETRAQLDFELVVCGSHSTGPYSEEQLLSLGTSKVKPVIQFGCRKGRGSIEYTGFVQQGKYIRPTFTFNLWTLRANSVIYDESTQILTAHGDVVWQDGRTSNSAKYLEITLHDPPRVVKVE